MIIEKGVLSNLKDFYLIGGLKGGGKSTRAKSLIEDNALAICFGGSNAAFWGKYDGVDKAIMDVTDLGDTTVVEEYNTVIVDGLNVWLSLYNVSTPNQWLPAYNNLYQQLNNIRMRVKKRLIVTCSLVEFFDDKTKVMTYRWGVGKGLLEKLNPNITSRELVWLRYDTKNNVFVGFYQDNPRLVSTFDMKEGIPYNA